MFRARDIIQPFLIGHYESISRYFDALRVLKGHSPEGLGAILNNDQFLYTTCEYAEEEKGIRFPLKRICRLKQAYVFFLYKLYLEYRGRQPFETINYAALLSQKVEMTYGDKKATLEISVRLGSHSYDAKIERLTWFVEKGKLRTTLKQVGIDEKIASTDNKIALYGVESEVLLQNNQKIKFTKIKGNKASVTLED